MGKRDRERRQRIVDGLEMPRSCSTGQLSHPVKEHLLVCGKCHVIMSDYRAAEHLKECQPGGAPCGKCGNVIKPTEFLEHFNNCKGRIISVKSNVKT